MQLNVKATKIVNWRSFSKSKVPETKAKICLNSKIVSNIK